MKKLTFVLMTILLCCCCVISGCRTFVPPDPPADKDISVKIDDKSTLSYHFSDWHGQDITYAPETVYAMMNSDAQAVSGAAHTLSIEFLDGSVRAVNPKEIFFSSVDAEGVQVSYQNSLGNVNLEEYALDIELDLSEIEVDTLLVLRMMIYDSALDYSGELFVAMKVAD